MASIIDIADVNFDEKIQADEEKRIIVPSELSFLNRTKKGTINLACAKTGVGKSMFLRHYAAALSYKYTVLYISLENDEVTDYEHFKVLQSIYPHFKKEHNRFFYCNGFRPWKCEDETLHEFVSAFDIVCIDGLETTVEMSDTQNSFEVYKNEVRNILSYMPEACVWLSWQMGRKFEGKEPVIEDIAFSYAAARLAYSAVAIYRDGDERIVKNIKGRGGESEKKGIIKYNEAFRSKDELIEKEDAKAMTDSLIDSMFGHISEVLE